MPVKRQSAFSRALREAQETVEVAERQQPEQQATMLPSDRSTVEPQHGATVEPSDRAAVLPPDRTTVPLSHRAVRVEPRDRDTVQLPDSATVPLPHGTVVIPSDRETVAPSERATVRHLQKTSFYLPAAHLEKLDDLAHAYKKRTGQRINRNDIVRHLVEHCALDTLDGLEPT